MRTPTTIDKELLKVEKPLAPIERQVGKFFLRIDHQAAIVFAMQDRRCEHIAPVPEPGEPLFWDGMPVDRVNTAFSRTEYSCLAIAMASQDDTL